MKCGRTAYYQQYDNGKTICLGTIEPQRKRAGRVYSVICDGSVEVTIRAEDEPYYGGSSAVLEVSWQCNKCGCTYYPELNLPNSYNISEWINNILKDKEST